MLGNFTFTLYEVFGYLLPGSSMFLAFALFYWSLFIPAAPLGLASLKPDLLSWTVVSLTSYVLGHAAQALGNVFFHGIESSLLDIDRGSAPQWMRKSAEDSARRILKVVSHKVEPTWTFRALDEYALQNGKSGDRDIFVYREGFYRGTALSLFILSSSFLVRMFIPVSLVFANGVVHVARSALFLTALITAGVGYLFVRRYRRFAEYRISRAVLAALIVQGTPANPSTSKPSRE
jgi:hypothetical protein